MARVCCGVLAIVTVVVFTVTCFASPDGVVVYLGLYDSVRAVEWRGGVPIQRAILTRGMKAVLDLAVDPDGNLLVADTLNQRLLLVDPATGDILQEIRTEGELPFAVEYAEDGSALVATAAGEPRLPVGSTADFARDITLWRLEAADGPLTRIIELGSSEFWFALRMALIPCGEYRGDLFVVSLDSHVSFGTGNIFPNLHLLIDSLVRLKGPSYDQATSLPLSALGALEVTESLQVACNKELLMMYGRYFSRLDLEDGSISEVRAREDRYIPEPMDAGSDCSGTVYALRSVECVRHPPLPSNYWGNPKLVMAPRIDQPRDYGNVWVLPLRRLEIWGSDGTLQKTLNVGSAFSLVVADPRAEHACGEPD